QPEEPETPEQPEEPIAEQPEEPETPEQPEEPETPSDPEEPVAEQPEEPETPSDPEEPVAEQPEEPVAEQPEEPVAEQPEEPETPEQPEEPVAEQPEEPVAEQPEEPETPEQPEEPVAEQPEEPETPEQPEEPETPEQPEEPVAEQPEPSVIEFTPEMGFLEEPIEVSEGIWFLGGKSPEELGLKSSSSNLIAADTTNADQLWSGGGLGLNLDGSGVTVGVWDEGSVRATHIEFGGRVNYGDSSSSNDHATHVAGTIGAAGVDSKAHGMANKVSIKSFDWDSDIQELRSAAQKGLSLSNHSYGWTTGWAIGEFNGEVIDTWVGDRGRFTEAENFGKYAGVSRDIDQVLYDNPDLLSVWAAGNDRDDQFSNVAGDNTYVASFSQNPGISGWKGSGWYRVPNSGATFAPGMDGGLGKYDSLSPQMTAKNTLVVGAINDITKDPYTKSDVSISSFSSFGLADDGRLKVDVVGNGVEVYSPVATKKVGEQAYYSDTSYETWNGTSMAAPNVTGTAALLTQHYKNLHGKTPLSATLKGTIIHTAAESGNVGPDYIYGWGVVDGAAAAEFLTDAKAETTSRLIEDTYNGSIQTYQLSSNGVDPLKATIVWTDPAGVAHGNGLDETTRALVNDLDIWIEDKNGQKYYPWTLDPKNPSASATQNKRNNLDNVEQVLITAPAAGIYTVHVGHSGNSFNQNYSLLISGIGELSKPTVTINANDSQASEPNNNGEFTVTRDGDTSSPLTVNYTVFGGAIAGNDYEDLGNSIVIPAGSTTAKIPVRVLDDSFVEVNETVVVNLASSNSYVLGTAKSATVNIADNDVAKSTITINSYDNYASEDGNSGYVKVSRSGGNNSQSERVYYSISGSASNGNDYSYLNSYIDIPAGSTTAYIPINPINDSIYEETETVSINLQSSSAYNTGSSTSGTVYIYDNDPKPKSTINLYNNDTSGWERNVGETPDDGQFYVYRSGGDNSKAETVYYSVSGSATNGSDYSYLSG
ncbi:S8 family serine peptidase, partial [Laspinema olomoucense]